MYIDYGVNYVSTNCIISIRNRGHRKTSKIYRYDN